MCWWCHVGGTKAGFVGGIVVVVVGVVMLEAAAEEDRSISHHSGRRLRRLLLLLPLILAGCVCVCACGAWSCDGCDAGDGDRKVMVPLFSLYPKLTARIYLECLSVSVCMCS